MTVQEAIVAIQVEGLEITGKLSRVNEFIQGLVVAEEALKKQAGIERALVSVRNIAKHMNQLQVIMEKENLLDMDKHMES